jgi:hypothetical protein
MVETRAVDGGIAHVRTLEPEEAFHLILVTREWRWNLDRLMALLQRSDLIRLSDEEAFADQAPPPVAAPEETPQSVERATDRVVAGTRFLHSLVIFVLVSFFAALLIVLWMDRPVHSFFTDMLIIAPGILGAGLFFWLWARRRSGHLPDAVKLTDVLMAFAGLIGGVFLLIFFLPSLFAWEGSDMWVDAVLVGLGLFLLFGSLKDLVSTARAAHRRRNP